MSSTTRRSRSRIDDARHFLKTTKQKFDAITSDPFDPWVKGAANLYTKEFWEAGEGAPQARRRRDGVGAALRQHHGGGEERDRDVHGGVPERRRLGQHRPRRGLRHRAVGTGRTDAHRRRRDGAALAAPSTRRSRSRCARSGSIPPPTLLSTYGGTRPDMRPWMADAEINRDRNLRLQFLAGFGVNHDQRDEIYRGILQYRRFPTTSSWARPRGSRPCPRDAVRAVPVNQRPVVSATPRSERWHNAVTSVSAPPPSLESLRCFVEAARLLNFRAAARAVALTPAALGQRIAQLEGQIGRALFHRTTRRVTLSEAGLALLGHAQQALEAADACLRAGRGETGPPPQDLVLGTRHELGMSWIVPMLPALAAPPSAADRPRLLRLGQRSADPRPHRRGPLRGRFDAHGRSKAGRRPPAPRGLRVRRATGAAPPDAAPAAGRRRPPHPARRTLRPPPLRLLARFSGRPRSPRVRRFRLPRDNRRDPCRRARGRWRRRPPPLPDRRRFLAAGRLLPILPRVRPLHDFFRLIFRTDDPRRSLYQSIATTMASQPLR